MRHRHPLLTFGLIALVGFLTVCPVFMLVVGSVSEGLEAFGHFTLAKYAQAYTDPAFRDVLLNTAVFTIGSAILATGLALFLAYLNTRTNIPFKSLFGVISIIPMMIPHILFAVSWLLLLNPTNGIINLFLEAFKKGMITAEQTGGIVPEWGDHVAYVKMVKAIV